MGKLKKERVEGVVERVIEVRVTVGGRPAWRWADSQVVKLEIYWVRGEREEEL